MKLVAPQSLSRMTLPRLADDVDATRRVRMAKRLKRGHMVNESGKRGLCAGTGGEGVTYLT